MLLWTLVGAVALAGSVWFHAQLPLARRIARDMLNDFVSAQIRGRLEIGRFDRLGLHHSVARHVALYDPHGERVAIVDRVVVSTDAIAGARGMLRFPHATLHGGTVQLIEGEGALPTLIELFEPAEPATTDSDAPGLHALVDEIELRDLTVYGEVLDLEGLRVKDLNARARLEVLRSLEVKVWSATGTVVEPFPFEGRFTHISGRIDSNAYKGLRLHARANGPRGDRVRANVEYKLPPDVPYEDPQRLNLLVHAMPVHAATLHELGYEWAEPLRGEIEGFFRLKGPAEDLTMHASLDTEGGPVEVDGRIRPTVARVEVGSKSVELARVVDDAPEVTVGGKAELLVEEGENGPPPVRIALEPFRYEGWAAPSLRLEGKLAEDALLIDRVRAPYGGGRAHGSGRIDFEGRIDIHLHLRMPQIARDPNLRRIVPGARAGLEANLRVHIEPDATRVDVDGTVMLRDVRYGPLRAEWLRAEGRVHGDPERPQTQLDVAGRDVRLADYPLGAADALLRGGPHRYMVNAIFEQKEDERRIELETTVHARPNVWTLDVPHLQLAAGDVVWRGEVKDVVWRFEREIEVGRLQLASGSQRLEAYGTWRFRGPERIHATLQDFDLTALRVIFPQYGPEVRGRMDSSLEVDGDIDNPKVLLQGALKNAAGYGLEDVSVSYVLTYEKGQIGVDSHVRLGRSGGTLFLTGSGIVEPDASPTEALRGGVYDIELAVSEVGLEVAHRLPLPTTVLSVMDGRISGKVEAEGPLQAPSFEGRLELPTLEAPGWPELGITTEFVYQMGTLNARLDTRDPHGALMEAETSLVVDLVNSVTNPEQTIASLETVPWRFAVRTPRRALRKLPAPLQALVPASLQPMQVALNGTFQGGALRTRGDLFATVEWDDDLEDASCGTKLEPHASIRARLRDDETTANLDVVIGGRAGMHVEASAPTPVSQWLRDAYIAGPPPVTISARMNDLRMQAVPVACTRFSGPVNGSIAVRDLFTDHPHASGRIEASRLRFRRFRVTRRQEQHLAMQTPPGDIAIEAQLSTERLDVRTQMTWWNQGTTVIEAHAPMRWGRDLLVPQLASGQDIGAEAQFDETPIAPFLAWSPGIVDIEGTLSGQATLSGSWDHPDLDGQLHLQRGYVQIVPLGQQLSELQGLIRLDGRWIEIEELVARDRGGELRLRGGVRIEGLMPSDFRFVLQPKKFPLRKEGAVLARLTGKAQVEGEVTLQQTKATLTLRKLNVKMPPQLTQTVQDLSPHPDVILGDDPVERDPGKPYRFELRLVSDRPFWVRRHDFAAQVETDMTAIYEAPQLRLRGSLRLKRGHFEVFGKRFEVNEAQLGFQGEDEVNPNVHLVAAHKLRSDPGQTVTVRVGGTLTRPTIDFSSSVPDCQSRAAVVALLATGECARAQRSPAQQEQAAQQTADFVASITAGVISLTTQQAFGEVLPEGLTPVLGGQRVGARFQADAFIPDFLRPIVRSAYIEGFYTRQSVSNTRTAQTGGRGRVLLELQFPKNIVGTGTFSPPDNWSVDLTWEP